MDMKEYVKEVYGNIARGQEGRCCYCSPAAGSAAYTEEDASGVPEGSDLGLGSGSPAALAGLKGGETVLDLGSGAGVDCFIAARKAGPSGRVIGVDMTPEMVEKARRNAKKGGFGNVEFRLGEIENLPVADKEVDIVISNCVINLSTDKPRTLKEAYRVLKPGGRIAISDVALLGKLPEEVVRNKKAYAGCVAGAVPVETYKELLIEAGFKDVSVKVNEPGCCSGSPPGAQATSPVVSLSITGRK